MGESYHHYLASDAGSGEYQEFDPQESLLLQQPMLQTATPDISSLNAYHQSLGYFTGFPDPIMFQHSRTQGSRSRKKAASGLEHVKHRRTRSGCYTCRSRRVKCDETHPICERCRKGKRECVYPEATAAKSSGGANAKREAASSSRGHSPTSSPDEAEDEGDIDDRLGSIADEEEPEEDQAPKSYSGERRAVRRTASGLNLRKTVLRNGSETPSYDGQTSSPASTDTAPGFNSSFFMDEPVFAPVSGQYADWGHLPADVQFYLNYFLNNITHLHYCMVSDSDDFFASMLLDIATQPGNEALLHSVVAFSAYRHALQDSLGNIQGFLQHYNKSVKALLSSFNRPESPTIATVATVLQLATIEAGLGNVGQLLFHHRAAARLIMQLFTPGTITNTPVSRAIFTWFIRFETGMVFWAGSGSLLPREYLSEMIRFAEDLVTTNPDNLGWKIEASHFYLCLICIEISELQAQTRPCALTAAQISTVHDRIDRQLSEWRANLDPALTSNEFLASNLDVKDTFKDDGIFNSSESNDVFNFPLFPSTILLTSWRFVVLIHKSQQAAALQTSQQADLAEVALQICRTYSVVEHLPFTVQGCITPLISAMRLATKYLPKEPQYEQWIRRKYAASEMEGFMVPAPGRAQMAGLFSDATCLHWWLPNDEGLTSSIRNLRVIADERCSLNGSESYFSPTKLRPDWFHETTTAVRSSSADSEHNPAHYHYE